MVRQRPAGDSECQIFFSRVEALQLSAVIGEQVIPAFPLFILMLLQILGVGNQDQLVSGSVGYLYEMILKQLPLPQLTMLT